MVRLVGTRTKKLGFCDSLQPLLLLAAPLNVGCVAAVTEIKAPAKAFRLWCILLHHKDVHKMSEL